jgi:hypothetical protein
MCQNSHWHLSAPEHFNLHLELLALIGHADPTLGDPPPHLYAASSCWTRQGIRTLLEAWSHVLTLEEPLPTLPLWLSADLVVPLNLEQGYEQACGDLWIARITIRGTRLMSLIRFLAIPRSPSSTAASGCP